MRICPKVIETFLSKPQSSWRNTKVTAINHPGKHGVCDQNVAAIHLVDVEI